MEVADASAGDNGAADREAVRAVLGGDRHRFGELVDRYQSRVYATVYRMVGRDAEAEDLTQQAFVEGFMALERYDQQRSFLTWLLRIAVNNCKDFLKSHKRRETSLQFETDSSKAMYAGSLRGPEQAAVDGQRLVRIEQALSTLHDKYRLPVILRDVEGLSYQQMEQVLDLPITTLKIRVVRGRQQLQQLLGDLRHD